MHDAYDKLVAGARHNLGCAADSILVRPSPAKGNNKFAFPAEVAASRLRGLRISQPEISKLHSVDRLGSGRPGSNREPIQTARLSAEKCITLSDLKTKKGLSLEARDARFGDTRGVVQLLHRWESQVAFKWVTLR
jgi:hypothetical protein